MLDTIKFHDKYFHFHFHLHLIRVECTVLTVSKGLIASRPILSQSTSIYPICLAVCKPMKPFVGVVVVVVVVVVIIIIIIIYRNKNKVKLVRDKEKYMISSSKIIVHSDGIEWKLERTNQPARHSPTPATNPIPLPTLRKAIPEQYPMTGNEK
jgi:hypothetical protein